MTTYHKWTDTENDYIRGTYNQPAAMVAKDLGLSIIQVRNRRSRLRNKDEAERFAYVVDQDLKEIEAIERKVNASALPVNLKKYSLSSSEMDGKLKQFRLFDGVYPEPVDEPKPSLWQRIKAFFTRG